MFENICSRVGHDFHVCWEWKSELAALLWYKLLLMQIQIRAEESGSNVSNKHALLTCKWVESPQSQRQHSNHSSLYALSVIIGLFWRWLCHHTPMQKPDVSNYVGRVIKYLQELRNKSGWKWIMCWGNCTYSVFKKYSY